MIGLQEVALWRRGPDGVKDGSATPSTTTVYDFLATLRAELGSRYRLGNVQNEADIEAPTNLGYDVRVTMRDAVLVRKRKGLRIRRKLGGNYAATFEVPTQIGTLSSRRGWTAIDGALRGKRFRFVDTHLEAFDDPARLAQARALAAGPLRKGGTVILVGDLNSDPTGATGAKPDGLQRLHGRRPARHLAAAQQEGHRQQLLPQAGDDHRPAARAVRPPRRPHLRQGALQGPAHADRRHRPGQPDRGRPVALRPRRRGDDPAAALGASASRRGAAAARGRVARTIRYTTPPISSAGIAIGTIRKSRTNVIAAAIANSTSQPSGGKMTRSVMKRAMRTAAFSTKKRRRRGAGRTSAGRSEVSQSSSEIATAR